MRSPRVMVLALALIAAGCPSSSFSLTVRLQSGLRAGHEVRFVEGRLYRGSVPCSTDAAPLSSAGRALAPADQSDLTSGSLSLTTFEGLEPGLYTVRARFRRPPTDPRTSSDSGPVLVERCLVTSLSSDRIVRIALTSDCLEVACPAPAGSPAFDQCLNGRCVDPRCDPEDPSTAELCCDRTALGDACDTDPTLCEAASDCTGTLGCAGTTRCEDGVCVEPETDGCPTGEYCDATARMCVMEPPLDTTMDAGLLDASRPTVDATMPDAPADDAFVAPGVDADLDAAPEPDAFVGLDAFTTADAYAPPGTDAFVRPDALVPRDAFEPDAPDVIGPEDCTLVGDEDGNGRFDCADSACSASPVCATSGCAPLTSVMAPSASIPAPLHWYRADLGVITSVRGEVCAMRDLAGSSHFFGILGALPMTATIAGRPALELAADAGMNAAGDLGLSIHGNYTLFILTQRATTMGTASVLQTWAPDSSTIFLQMRQSSTLPAAYSLRIRGGTFAVGTEAATTPSVESVVARSLRSGNISTNVSYYRDGTLIGLSLSAGSDAPGAGVFAGLPATVLGGAAAGPVRVAEIVIYGTPLSSGERAMVEAYLSSRYGIVLP